MASNPFQETMRQALLEATETEGIEQRIDKLYEDNPASFKVLRNLCFADLQLDELRTFDKFKEGVNENRIKIFTAPLLDYDRKTMNIFGTWLRRFNYKMYGYAFPMISMAVIMLYSYYSSNYYNLLGLVLIPFGWFFGVGMNPFFRIVMWISLGVVLYSIVVSNWTSFLHSAILLFSLLGSFGFRRNFRMMLIESVLLSERALLLLAGIGMINIYMSEDALGQEIKFDLFSNVQLNQATASVDGV